MSFLIDLFAIAIILVLLADALETTVLPRRVTHKFRLARTYYRTVWRAWRAMALAFKTPKHRESFLSYFGPLSLLGLLAIWVVGLIFAFALLHWSLNTRVHVEDERLDFFTYMYWSGGTFFTLGYGDIVPETVLGRFIAVMEAGIGFGFLALIISYLPVINQAYSRRESLVALLDARAGSPPSAVQMLVRLCPRHGGDAANQADGLSNFTEFDSFLAEWERWAAELLESQLSFPVLSYYRSQHDNQSWLSSLTAMLDTCAVLMSGVKDANLFQAQLTFAMSRHAAVDIALIFKIAPTAPDTDRLPTAQMVQLYQQLHDAGFQLRDIDAFTSKLTELRDLYEPFVCALSRRFLFGLPSFVPPRVSPDNWQRSSWKKKPPKEMTATQVDASIDGHFK
jgi:voltage-gated potassium channel Kch